MQIVIPLCEGLDAGAALDLIKSCDEEACVQTNDLGVCHIRYVPSILTFIPCPYCGTCVKNVFQLHVCKKLQICSAVAMKCLFLHVHSIMQAPVLTVLVRKDVIFSDEHCKGPLNTFGLYGRYRCISIWYWEG